MPACTLLDRKRKFRVARAVSADPRRHFGGDINGWPHPEPAAQTDEERVLIEARRRRGVMDPNRRGIQGGAIVDHSREYGPQRRCAALFEIVRAFHRYETRD